MMHGVLTLGHRAELCRDPYIVAVARHLVVHDVGCEIYNSLHDDMSRLMIGSHSAHTSVPVAIAFEDPLSVDPLSKGPYLMHANALLLRSGSINDANQSGLVGTCITAWTAPPTSHVPYARQGCSDRCVLFGTALPHHGLSCG